MTSAPWSIAAVFSLILLPAMAVEPPSRSERLSWQAAARFLDLSSQQVVRVQAARAERERALSELRLHAKRMGTGKAAAAAMAGICRQASESEAAFHGKVAALLDAPQLARLEQLRQALYLMPLIESAQAAGLLQDTLNVPVPGLPQGSAEVAVQWQRVTAKPLPGCSGTTVIREVSTGEDETPRKPQR